MNQSSTRTLSKSYFALPKNDVIGLVLAAAAGAAAATAVALGICFFFFLAAAFFGGAAVNQLPFRLEAAVASMLVSISSSESLNISMASSATPPG